jgi:hypothetical protein
VSVDQQSNAPSLMQLLEDETAGDTDQNPPAESDEETA